MKGGWICSYRAIWDHPFFKGNGMRVAVWHWLLHHAAHRETTHTVSGVKLAIRRGEVCFSQQQIQDDTGATRKQVRDVLEWLIGNGKAVKIGANERANGGANVRANARTILRIEKYEEYQNKPSGGANERANGGATNGPTKEQDNNIPVGEDDKSTSSEVVVFEGVRGTVWRVGRALLARHGVTNASIIGKWIKDAKSASRVLELIEAAEIAQTEDPISYITKAVQGKTRSDRQADEEKAARIARWEKIQ